MTMHTVHETQQDFNSGIASYEWKNAAIVRAWINQPSTLQPYHQWHGVNVLSSKEGTVYFLDGAITSMHCPRFYLSAGWI